MSLASGTRLGPYEIISPIGAGAMGEVYKAKDTRLGRDVAIKVLPAEFAQDPERLRRFEQEARAAAALNHPNILVLYDIGTHDGAPYIVTELLEGESLRQRLRGGPLPPAKAVEFGVQIAQGLAAAHEKGIVHRDLKPENLWVTKDGRVKILDFGLARLRPEVNAGALKSEMPTSDSPTRQGMVLGTVGYMAPEQVRGEAADPRSDIFSFGCVLYEMVSGKQAFLRETSAETMTAILREEPPELAGTRRPVPSGLERIVRRCIEKRPEERFQSARDLAFGLEAFSGLTGTGAIPALVGAKGGGRFPWSSRPWVVAGALGLGLILGVAAGVLVQRRGEHPSQPAFHQLTFRRGAVMSNARFTPDGKEIIYGAAWDGNPDELFSVRPGSPESRSLGFGNARLHGIFPNGDLLIRDKEGNLAVAPMNAGAPRAILTGVRYADPGPDVQHIAISRMESGVYRIEYPVGKVLYETPKRIDGCRLSHKRDRIAFSQDDALMVVDMAGKAISLTRGWPQILSLAWTPSDDEIWFASSRQGANYAINGVTLSGRERLVLRGTGLLIVHDIAADGRVLLHRQTTRFGFVVGDTKTREERDLSWFDQSNLAVLSSDGSRVLFHEDGEAVGGRPILYMRGTDGSPPVRLGEGYPVDLSPDGEWVIASLPRGKDQEIRLVPTGAGEAKPLLSEGWSCRAARFFPDGQRFVFFGNERGNKPRFWITSVEGGAPKPLTPEGNYRPAIAVSPDSRDIAVSDLDGERIFLVPAGGGKPRPLPGEHEPGAPVNFNPDGKALLVRRGNRVFRVDLQSGRESLVHEFKPPDPAGFYFGQRTMTPDEKMYAYGYFREASEIYLAEGVK